MVVRRSRVQLSLAALYDNPKELKRHDKKALNLLGAFLYIMIENYDRLQKCLDYERIEG